MTKLAFIDLNKPVPQADIPTISIVGIHIPKAGFTICRHCCDVTAYDSGYVYSDKTHNFCCFYCGTVY